MGIRTSATGSVFFGPDKLASLSPDTMKFPVPDLAVEVLSPSTEVRDRGVKFEDFASNGVADSRRNDDIYFSRRTDHNWTAQSQRLDGFVNLDRCKKLKLGGNR